VSPPASLGSSVVDPPGQKATNSTPKASASRSPSGAGSPGRIRAPNPAVRGQPFPTANRGLLPGNGGSSFRFVARSVSPAAAQDSQGPDASSPRAISPRPTISRTGSRCGSRPRAEDAAGRPQTATSPLRFSPRPRSPPNGCSSSELARSLPTAAGAQDGNDSAAPGSSSPRSSVQQLQGESANQRFAGALTIPRNQGAGPLLSQASMPSGVLSPGRSSPSAAGRVALPVATPVAGPYTPSLVVAPLLPAGHIRVASPHQYVVASQVHTTPPVGAGQSSPTLLHCRANTQSPGCKSSGTVTALAG